MSEPIIPFMETIVPRPKLDMRQETIVAETSTSAEAKETIEMDTSNKQCTLRLRAVPLSTEIVDILKQYEVILSAIEQRPEKGAIGQRRETLAAEAREKFQK